MRAPSSRLLRDTIAVHALADTLDDEGGPVEADGAATATLAASVQRVTSTSLLSHRADRHGGIESSAGWNVLFATDPGVTAAGQLLLWTHHDGTALAVPVALRSLGPAEPPGGLMARWTVACQRVS